jgi:hypothetical protein
VSASRGRPSRASRAGAAALAALLLGATASACGATSGASPGPDGPGPGVVFGWPVDGQWDVPVGARVILSFSRPLPVAVDTACARTTVGGTGAFCVEGPSGFVPGALTVEGATLVFVPTNDLAAGTTYRVWARPALLPGATNLRTDTPLLTFHTRDTRQRAGQAATVVTVNGSPLAAHGTSPRPFHDVAPIRLVFSEPLDPATIGTAVRVVRLADGRAVDGRVLASGIHLTFQASGTLRAGEAYRLEIAATVRDLGGEAIKPVSVAFTPRRTAPVASGLLPLPMIVEPPWTATAALPASRLAAMPVNTYAVSSRLPGIAGGGVLPGGLHVLAGDPAAGTSLPLLIRRGERLDLMSRSTLLGIEAGVVHLTLAADAFGLQIRNPFRSPSQEPDDAESPTFLDLTMDAALSSDSPIVDEVISQTIMGIRVLGVFSARDGQLTVEQVSQLEHELLGLETAPLVMAQRMRTAAPGSGSGP